MALGSRRVVMIGTHFDTMGGISAVVNVYRSSRLFERQQITYIATHCDGSAAQKLRVMALAWMHFVGLLLVGRIDLLHVHLSSRASFWRKLMFLVPVHLFRVPVILHLHGSEFAVFYEKECSAMGRRLVRWAFDRAARVLVLSEAWADWVRSITSNPGLRVLYNPVMSVQQGGASPTRRASQRVLFLGRMGQRKGSYDLVRALAMARANGADLELFMGGDGDRAGVEALAISLGIGQHVHFLGWVRGDVKQEQLALATVFVLPSYHEGLPMGILEAMAAGLPIVSTPVGGIPEAVTDGVEGFLVSPGDVAALAARLTQLAQEPQLAQAMGEAARQKVARCFAADVILPRVEALYDEVLSR